MEYRRPGINIHKKRRSHRPLMIIGLIVLSTLLVAGGVYLFSVYNKHKQLNNIAEPESPVYISDENKPEAEPDDPVRQRVKELLDQMSIEEKVGQMFIVRVPTGDAVAEVTNYQMGGYIMFGRDFTGKTKQQIADTVTSYQQAAKTPLLIGVDEEGGIVNRVSTNPNLRAVPFWAPKDLLDTGGLELVKSDTEEKADLLHSLGINLNFAPVSDVSENPSDFIFARTTGRNANETANYVKTVVEAMREKKLGSALKHFPGYGNNTDTHTGVAYDNRPIETFRESDFLPFQAGINAGANMVLVSHNIVSAFDGEAPASLSANIHQVLRNELNFNGVIITDDLVMDGVRSYAGDAQVAVKAVLVGNDMLCCTNYQEQIPAVIQAVKNGEISEDRINESVLRILELKINLGIV